MRGAAVDHRMILCLVVASGSSRFDRGLRFRTATESRAIGCQIAQD